MLSRDLPPYGEHGEEERRRIDEMILSADLAVCALLSLWLEEIRHENDKRRNNGA